MYDPFTEITERLDRIEKLLILYLKSQKQPDLIKEVGGIEYAVELTGLAKHTIYKYVSEGRIPYYKPVGTQKLIFKRSELIDWLVGDEFKNESA